jgi:fucose permease
MQTREKIKLNRMDYAGAIGMFAYSSSAVMTPICMLKLMEEFSFSLTGGAGIEAVRTFLMLVILLTSGFAAAHWGKSLVLTFGSVALAAGMFAYAVAPAYSVVLSAMILVGLGSGIMEGLINPLVQETHPTDSGRYLNIVNAFWSVGVLSTVLVVGELLTRGVSWRLLMACSGGFAIISAVLMLLVRGSVRKSAPAHAGHNKTAAENTRKTWLQMKEILKQKRFWVFAAALFSGGGAEATFTFWSASYVQIEYGALPRAGGFGTACFAGGMIAGRMLSGHYVHQKGLKNLILISGIVGIVVSLFVYAVGSLAGFYVCVFFAGLTAACFWPSIQSYAADCLKTDATMIFILLSCAGIPGFGFAPWLMGVIGDLTNIRTSFAVVPFFFLMLVLIIAIDHRVHRPRSAN